MLFAHTRIHPAGTPICVALYHVLYTERHNVYLGVRRQRARPRRWSGAIKDAARALR